MCAVTLKEYQQKQLENIENWVKKQKATYELSTIKSYWKELSINHATFTNGKTGELCNVLILNCEYEGLYTPVEVWEVWERVEYYLRCRALPNLKIELRGFNQSMWIYFE